MRRQSVLRHEKTPETLDLQGFSGFGAEGGSRTLARVSKPPTPLAGEPLRPLGYFCRNIWRSLAERVGFEPTDAFTSPVFKTGAFDHSAISPCVKVHSTQTQDLLYHRGLCLSTINKERKDVFSRKNGLTFVGGGGIINKLIPFRECKSEYPGVAKFGIALEWGSRGLEFESRHSDHELS